MSNKIFDIDLDKEKDKIVEMAKNRRYNLIFYIAAALSVIPVIWFFISDFIDFKDSLDALKDSFFFGNSLKSEIFKIMIFESLATITWIAGLILIIYYNKMGFWLCIASRIILMINFFMINSDFGVMFISTFTCFSPLITIVILCLVMETTKYGLTAFEVLFNQDPLKQVLQPYTTPLERWVNTNLRNK